MWATIIKTILKAIGKYTAKYMLRRSGVFGVYGTFKSAGGFKNFVKNLSKQAPRVVGNLVKKNFLRSLHTSNFILDWKRFGLMETAKRVALKRFTPMEVKKMCYFFKEIKMSVDEKKLKLEVQNNIWEPKTPNKYQKLVANDIIRITKPFAQTDLLDQARKYRPHNEEDKKLVKEFITKIIKFRVKSPETRNFNRKIHIYDQGKKLYYVPIRSGSHKYIRVYAYDNIPWRIAKEAIRCRNYGRYVFDKFRTDK